MHISVTSQPDTDDALTIDKNLAAYNNQDVGPADRRSITVIVRDDRATILAGINGMTAWGWLYVQRLWVSNATRGQGLAGKMLEAAEAEARQRGCHSAYIDTFNPVALKTYKRHGYAEYGVLPLFVAGRDRVFLWKKL